MSKHFKNKIYLFDLDGTLLRTGGAGRATFVEALSALSDEAEKALDFSFSGLTDPIIIQRGLKNAGLAPKPKYVREIKRRYLAELKGNLRQTEDVEVFSGAVEIVKQLRDHPDFGRRIEVGVGTGNFERGAIAKLASANLDHLFEFGGYGSDAYHRPDLLKAGIEKGMNRLGAVNQSTEAIIIGDTPKDIEAAKQIGAKSIAVSTGSYSVEQLEAASPTEVVENLRNSARI